MLHWFLWVKATTMEDEEEDEDEEEEEEEGERREG